MGSELLEQVEVFHTDVVRDSRDTSISQRGGERFGCHAMDLSETGVTTDRTSPGEWQEGGSRTIYEHAHERVQEILGSHYPEYLDPKIDARIRERFPIRLDPADMLELRGRSKLRDALSGARPLDSVSSS